MYFDSHAHLDDAHFDGDRADILDDLKNHGVTMVMNVGCDLPPPARHLIAPTFVCKKPLRQNRSGSFCFLTPRRGGGR